MDTVSKQVRQSKITALATEPRPWEIDTSTEHDPYDDLNLEGDLKACRDGMEEARRDPYSRLYEGPAKAAA